MLSFMQSISGKFSGKLMLAVAGAAFSAWPTLAMAGHGDRDRGRDYREHDRGGMRVEVGLPIFVQPDQPDCEPPPVCDRETRVWVEPTYRTVTERQWVEPAYQTVTEQVWVPAVVQPGFQRIWVPDRFEWRDVVRFERGRERVCREMVLVEPGHFVERHCDTVVTPGHYENVQRQQQVCEGHWQMVPRQECLTPGHWETRMEPVVVAPRPASVRLELRLPF